MSLDEEIEEIVRSIIENSLERILKEGMRIRMEQVMSAAYGIDAGWVPVVGERYRAIFADALVAKTESVKTRKLRTL